MTSGEEVLSHVRAICEDLDADDCQEDRAAGYARRAWMEYPVNRSPASVAASAVYMASLYEPPKFDQQEVAEAAGVAESTVGAAYHELHDHEFPSASSSGEEEDDDDDSLIDSVKFLLSTLFWNVLREVWGPYLEGG